jgi:hypothetical protein
MIDLPRPDPIPPFHYSASTVPPQYHCAKCRIHGVKLWLAYIDRPGQGRWLVCAYCNVDDPTANYIPGIPSAEGEIYRNLIGPPHEGYFWWNRLPTHPPENAP